MRFPWARDGEQDRYARAAWDIWQKAVVVKATGREGIAEMYDQGNDRALVRFSDGSSEVVHIDGLQVRERP